MALCQVYSSANYIIKDILATGLRFLSRILYIDS